MFARLRSLLRVFGPGWLAFRAGYGLRKRLGLLRLSCPSYAWGDRPLARLLAPGIPADLEGYARWRAANHPRYLFEDLPPYPFDPSQPLAEAEAILHGSQRFFCGEALPSGFPPDWSLDLSTGVSLPLDCHWSGISDEGRHDIKYVWEPARFFWAYSLARAYAAAQDERYAEGFWTGLEDWMARNPPNRGPGWMDGQECALRLNAACFALAVFRDSPSVTPARLAAFTQFVAALGDRIRANLGYAISTRSNHTIAEAFGLWLAGVQFPELRTASTWRSLGRRLLIREAANQLFSDGGYAMYSLNYQRFALHLYCLALRLGEILEDPFPREIYDRVEAAADFLYQLVDPTSGEMPEFGSNDGAMVLPLDACGYNDHRPLIQLCHYTAHRARLFPPGPWDEPLYWFYGPRVLALPTLPLPEQTSRAFNQAGVYTLRSANTLSVLRCVNYRSRPSHADILHLDIRMRGSALAVDAGTFSYHAPGVWRNGLSGAAVHNTVMVDHTEPMTRLGRFTWGDWPDARLLRREPGLLAAEHDGYLRLPDPVACRRIVQILPGERILVVDELAGKKIHRFALHWLLADEPFTELSDGPGVLLAARAGAVLVRAGGLGAPVRFSLTRGDGQTTRGWRSRTYGRRDPAISLILEAEAPEIRFWTLFGLPGDSLEAHDSHLVISTASGPLQFDLGAPNVSAR